MIVLFAQEGGNNWLATKNIKRSMLTACKFERGRLTNTFGHCVITLISAARHHMQEDDTQQDHTTRSSMSRDKNMNDKRDQARRLADELIAEEKQHRSAVTTYLVAAIVGLVFWTVVYFIWRAL